MSKFACLLLLLPALAFAQAPADADAEHVKSVVVKVAADPATPEVIPPLADGIYFLLVKAGQPSQISAVRTAVVVGPGPVPPGPTPALNDFGKSIKAAADKATGDTDRLNTAQGLAFVYRAISLEAHKKETTATLETISNTTLLFTDTALAKQGPTAVAAWADTRALLRAALVDSAQKGQKVSEMGDILDQAATALELSAPKSALKPSPEFWAFLMKLLEMLLPLLLPLLGG